MLRIKELRKIFKLTQEDIAEKFDVDRVTVSRWENGQNDPPVNAIIEMSKMFNVPIGYLLGQEVNMFPSPIRLSEDTSALNNYASSSKTKKRYSNVAAEITEKVAALDASEQKEILQVVDAILVRKKYTPGPDGEEESS